MNADEAKVRNYLSACGLQAERLERKIGKAPDFRVLLGDQLQFFCEVKSIERDVWLDRQFDEAASSIFVGGSRPDPIFNRLTDDIHTAIKQFVAVNPSDEYPNVLALVNHDELCGVSDLIGILTGGVVSADGKALPIYVKFSHGRIKNEKRRVHLFIWLDDGQEHLVFTKTHKKHHQTLCSLFEKKCGSIAIIGG